MSRHFTKWSTISYAVSVLGVLGSMPATFGVPLSLGGPASTVWAWLVGSIMASIISASGKNMPQPGDSVLSIIVAELVSAYPTAGGSEFSP